MYRVRLIMEKRFMLRAMNQTLLARIPCFSGFKLRVVILGWKFLYFNFDETSYLVNQSS